MPPQQQRLIYGGRQMYVLKLSLLFVIIRSLMMYTDKSNRFYLYRQDDKTVKELGVKAGDVLHLVLALRGGGW